MLCKHFNHLKFIQETKHVKTSVVFGLEYVHCHMFNIKLRVSVTQRPTVRVCPIVSFEENGALCSHHCVLKNYLSLHFTLCNA